MSQLAYLANFSKTAFLTFVPPWDVAQMVGMYPWEPPKISSAKHLSCYVQDKLVKCLVITALQVCLPF